MKKSRKLVKLLQNVIRKKWVKNYVKLQNGQTTTMTIDAVGSRTAIGQTDPIDHRTEARIKKKYDNTSS